MVEARIILNCPEDFRKKAQYVFDTMFMTMNVPVQYVNDITDHGNDFFYISYGTDFLQIDSCLNIFHSREAYQFFKGSNDVNKCTTIGRNPVVFSEIGEEFCGEYSIPFDIIANAFYFLSSWSEQTSPPGDNLNSNCNYDNSVYNRLGISTRIVDYYQALLVNTINTLLESNGSRSAGKLPPPVWSNKKTFAVALSHDVDFIPESAFKLIHKLGKSVFRNLFKRKNPLDAIKVVAAFLNTIGRLQNPYRCIPIMIKQEKEMGVKSAYPVQSIPRHSKDVNYSIDNNATKNYLQVILDEKFELCLHGSYTSIENSEYYIEEVCSLAKHFQPPEGSRQHYLSFNFKKLFAVQEVAGIQYDMSVGFNNQVGFRPGYSHPYFPYNLEEDRPYNVLEISLFMMDVSFVQLKLSAKEAFTRIKDELKFLKETGGAGSVCWHPILFAGARDPGFEDLYWDTVRLIIDMGGYATAPGEINAICREKARKYLSFQFMNNKNNKVPAVNFYGNPSLCGK